jgi:hypothetical protein
MVGTSALQAQCLTNTSQTQTFNSYIASCRTNSDTVRANNLFSPSINDFKNTFTQMRAEFDNLLIAGDNAAAIASLTGSTTSEANNQLNELTKKKDMTIAEMKQLRAKIEASDRTFLDTVMSGPNEKQNAPSLQDVALLIFWFGWIVITVTIVAVRWTSPGGGWRAGLFTLGLMALVTLCVYAVLLQVA